MYQNSQLDWLWWMWQQRNPLLRLGDYAGKDRASLDDVLPMDGFAPDMQASDVMSTESDVLCYKY